MRRTRDRFPGFIISRVSTRIHLPIGPFRLGSVFCVTIVYEIVDLDGT